MGPLTRSALVAVPAAAAAAAAVLVLGHEAPVRGLAPAAPLQLRASFAPADVSVGDRFVARAVVLADRKAVDTGRLRVTQDVAPLVALSPAHVTRTVRGRVLVVSSELQVSCLDEACVGAKGPVRLRLPAATAAAPRRGGGDVRVSAAWPELEIHGRVSAADAARTAPPFRADTSYPPVRYRIAPGTLALLLDVVAALLAAAGAAWAAHTALGVRRRRRAIARGELERALALTREAAARPPADRRRAVGLLARVLQTRHEPLSSDAGELAWSEPPPTPEAVTSLAARVAEEVEP